MIIVQPLRLFRDSSATTGSNPWLILIANITVTCILFYGDQVYRVFELSVQPQQVSEDQLHSDWSMYHSS